MKKENIIKLIKLLFAFEFKEIIRLCRIKWFLLTQQGITFIYNDSFFKQRRRDKKWTKDFCELIMRIFNPKSVVDFGCGNGDILAPFESLRVRVLGIDGSRSALKYLKISKSNFKLFNLKKQLRLEEKFDLCFSFEVAEHLLEAFSDIFIENVVSSQAEHILFTAAKPGQRGTWHVNLKPQEWWIEKFRKKGYVFAEDLTQSLKREMPSIQGIEGQFIKNLLIFKRSQ